MADPRASLNRAPVMEQAAAQQHNWGIRAAATDGDLEGLVKGLSAMNPGLTQYAQQAAHDQDQAARKAAIAEAQAAAARADMATYSATELAAQPAPSTVPPAYGGIYRETLTGLLGDRAGIKSKADLITQYEQNKDKPDFNPEAFFAQGRQQALAGFTDPFMAANAGRHINEAEAMLRNSMERDRMIKLEETTNTALTQKFEDSLRGDMTPQALFEAYTNELVPAGVGLNKSRKDMAKFLFERVSNLSSKMGGRPDLFDVFDLQDETKTSLSSYNKDLAPHIASARAHAKATLEKQLEEAAQPEMLKTEMALQDLAMHDPEKVTYDLLLANTGPRKAMKNHEEAVGLWVKAQNELDRLRATKALSGNWENRTMYDLTPEQQQKVMEEKLGPYSQKFKEAVMAKDLNVMEQLAQGIMQVGSKTNATVAFGPLARFTQVVSSTVPNPEGPDDLFKASASLYKAFSGDTKFRDMYFKDDTAKVMDSYTKAVANGTDPKAAYLSAFTSISPEGKAAAEKYGNSPEGKKAAEKAVKEVIGTNNWWPAWLGGAPNVANNTHVSAWAQAESRDYMSKNPYASDKDLGDYLKSAVAQNYVMDANTGSAIRVPTNLANEATQQALTEYSKRLSEAHRLKDRSGLEWTVQFRPSGTEGVTDIVLASGGREEHMGRLPISAIVDAHRKEKMLSPEERTTLLGIRDMVKGGTFDPTQVEANRDLIAKARAIGALPKETLKALDDRSAATMRERLASIPKMSFGVPDFTNLASVPSRGIKVDNKLTAQVAMKFATSPVTNTGTMHQSLAASLTTMGEAVMLQAYPDPAKDAGYNIGMGYNLKANAKEAPDDLKRAGVPADMVQAVISGKAQITPEQASRLLMVTMPRYEKSAKDAAESTSPGLWGKMTPAQKAVMTDISYQVGSSGQFKKAWAALAAGDSAAFSAASKVFYTNKDGVKVEDTRRNSLRAAMLEGTEKWSAVVSKYGSFPSNQMESLALNTKK